MVTDTLPDAWNIDLSNIVQKSIYSEVEHARGGGEQIVANDFCTTVLSSSAYKNTDNLIHYLFWIK